MAVFRRPDELRSDQMMGEYELLCRQRVVFCYGEIGSLFGSVLSISPMDGLLALDVDSNEPIKMIVDSPGGSIGAGMALYDTMKMLKSEVWTIGRTCCSMATIILAAGTPGHRYLYPHSRVMIHLPWGGVAGDVKEIEIQSKEMNKMKDSLVQALIDCGVKKTKKQILKDMDREFWLDAEEAIKYGVADKIITPGILY